MYDIYLTEETLYLLCKNECKRHGVNFQYFYTKIVHHDPIPLTQGQCLDLLDELLATAYWNDYDEMYKGIEYPKWAQSHRKVA